MGRLAVVVPSHKRADHVLVKKVISDVILCVADDQVAEYKEHNPDVEIVGHPSDMKGLPLKRNWICERFGDVFMVDDDVYHFRDYTPERGTGRVVSPDEARDHVERLAEMSRDLGIFLFGFTSAIRPLYYKPQKPYALTGLVSGHAMGLLRGSELYWHPKAITDGSQWLCALNAYHHRMILKDLRYGFVPESPFVTPGGQAEHRNMSVEAEMTLFLRRHFGDVCKQRGGEKSKDTHAGMRVLDLPF